MQQWGIGGPTSDEQDEPETPGEPERRPPPPVLMLFAIGAGIAVLVSGFFIGFSPLQIVIGIVGVVVGLWSLLVLRHQLTE